MFAKFSVLIGLQNISIDPHFYKDIPQMSIKEELTDWQLTGCVRTRQTLSEMAKSWILMPLGQVD